MPEAQPHSHLNIRAARAWEAGRLSIRSDRQGTAHVITVSGELDLATAAVLADELDAALATDAQLIDLDLSGLTFIALRGLRVVSAARTRAVAQGDRLEVRHFPAHIQRVVEMTASLDTRSSSAV
jgi:anti-sigma B factor antagonist